MGALLSCALLGSPLAAPQDGLAALQHAQAAVALAREARAFGGQVPRLGLRFAALRLQDAYQQGFHRFSLMQVVPLRYEVRDARWFGVWQAADDFGAAEASDEGLLTQWAQDYYITHDWSAYGQQILQLQPGDTLRINDLLLEVDDIFCYPRAAYLEEVREVVGHGVVVLQTCEPGTDLDRIVVARRLG